MTNSPIATREETKYFTPRSLHRIPVSEYDWQRLKEMSTCATTSRDWPPFVRSLSLGICASAVFNLVQLYVLQSDRQYPVWAWVVAFVLLVGSAITAALTHVLTSATERVQSASLTTVHQELLRIEGTFDPPVDDTEVQSEPDRSEAHVGLGTPIKGRFQTDAEASGVFASSAAAQEVRRRNSARFAVGDRVRHPKFGSGVVVERDGDAAVVQFDEAGRKRLLIGYAPLRPIEQD